MQEKDFLNCLYNYKYVSVGSMSTPEHLASKGCK